MEESEKGGALHGRPFHFSSCAASSHAVCTAASSTIAGVRASSCLTIWLLALQGHRHPRTVGYLGTYSVAQSLGQPDLARTVQRSRVSAMTSAVWLSAAVIAISAACYALFVKLQNSLTGNLGSRRTNPTRGSPGGKIVIHSFFTPVGKLAASASPFTAKIEAFLRFKGLAYTEESSGFDASPNGRVSVAIFLEGVNNI